MRDMREQPAGWYRDTDRPNLHRYWTGERWSDWVGEELAVAERARVPEQSHATHRFDEQGYAEQRYDERACG
jgi:hypothetical protein